MCTFLPMPQPSMDTYDMPSYSDEQSQQPLQPLVTYASCFGLPYQDHNYGAPPPPSPPQSPPPVPKINGQIWVEEPMLVNVSTTKSPSNGTPAVPAGEEVDDSITRCICDFQHDDGYMICCDKCSVWQHIDCMGIDRLNIPDAYFCELCQPRKVDKQKAIIIQTHKRELLNDSSSSTDTDIEMGFHNNSNSKANATLPVHTAVPNNKKQVRGKQRQRKNSKESPAEKNDKKNKKVKVKKEKKEKEKVQPTVLIKEKPINNIKEKNKIRELNRKTKVKSPRPALGSVIVNEDARDSWQNSTCDSYEEAKCSVYSSEVKNLLASKFNSQSHKASVDSKPNNPTQLQVQLCQLAQVTPLRKGLECTEDVGSSVLLMEFIGKVMLKEQFDKENIFFKRNHPYVLFYSKLDQIEMCVDASSYGNEGRYLRRSCVPNCEVRHFIENSNLHFYVYSTKSIIKGAELCIPFDFDYRECNYGVECACTRTSCPVKKFNHKKFDSPSLSTKPVSKRRKSAKSTEQKEVTSPPTTREKESQKKRRLSSPLHVSVSAELPEPETPTIAPPSSSMQSPKIAVKQEDQSQQTNPSWPANQVDHQSQESSDAEAERRKKMTREERKMEAIMKAFEKLEKREERRKEALARLEVTKKPKDGEVCEEAEQQVDLETEKQTMLDERNVAVKEPVVVKEEVKPEPPKVEKPKPVRKKGKRHSTPARRRSRYNSSGPATSGLSDGGHSQDESSNTGYTTTPSSSLPQTPQPEASLPVSPAAGTGQMFRFPKTKKHMMNEWMTEKSSTPDLNKPLSIKTEPLEVSTASQSSSDFVRCLPSPHASSLTHLRRSSTSSTGTAASTHHGQPKVSGSVQNHDTNLGSAKKRWLRQAMFESNNPSQCVSGSMSPIHLGGMSPIPNSCANSPGASPQADFVTPLKKRRLARESLSRDSPCLPTPTTPSTPVLVRQHADDVDTDKFDLGQASRSRNGYQNNLLPITPITPNDNLFDVSKEL